MSIADDKSPWTNGYADQAKRIKELEDELYMMRQAIKKAWFILDDVYTERADEWQNKYAWVFDTDYSSKSQ